GLRRRIEVSEPLPEEGLTGLGADGPVGRRLRALVGGAPLIRLLEVRTRRHPYRLGTAERPLGEVDVDDTIIVIGDDQYPARLRRVEIETAPGGSDLLAPLVDRMRRDCHLQPATLSKFEVGLLAAGIEVPTQPELGPTTLGRDASVASLAYAVLRRNLGAMLAHEAGTRLGEDIEQLHDMRVATRRLRAALDLFEKVLPERAGQLNEELGWLARELGFVRDLDVQLERLDAWREELPGDDAGALADLASLLDRERDNAREQLLAALDSARYEQMVYEFTALVRRGPEQGAASGARAAREPATALVPRLILARHKAATTAARRARRSGDPTDLHRLRIRCKRLRYALEFAAEIYDGRTKPVARRVARLQDCLGLVQDAQVAAARLHDLAVSPDSALSPAAVFAMGTLAERYRRESERLRATLPTSLTVVKKGAWRKLTALMERRGRVANHPGTDHPHRRTPRDPMPLSSPAGDPQRPPAPWPPAPSSGPAAPDAPPPEDPGWEDVEAPALRPVPLDGPEPDGPAGPGDDHRAPPGPTRRDPPEGVKEPVFLPPSPPRAEPGVIRPLPRRPAPEEQSHRSFPDLS
ncbi:MAG TPA: CHAD domain-containing protein, partial [Acidimicrobiales bacterium]|nr:CHAD domain-containing protein [Acidimicrobiales bacterium]